MTAQAPWIARQAAAAAGPTRPCLAAAGAVRPRPVRTGLGAGARPGCATSLRPAGACGQCPSCHAIEVRAHTDLCVLMPETIMLELGWPLGEKAQKEIDDKKRKPSKEIRVEAMRDAVEFAQRTSGRGRGKVVLVYPAERMNHVTANALLKTLEEPAGDVRFVLASEAAHQLLPTIRSRCLGHTMAWPVEDEAVRLAAGAGRQGRRGRGLAARGRRPARRCAVVFQGRPRPQGLGAPAQGPGARRRRCAGRLDARPGHRCAAEALP